MENGFHWREPEKKSVQLGTNWLLQCCDCMVFLPLTFLASAKKNVSNELVDSSAGTMFTSASGSFLSFLHAKVGRERLVYFIVSNHSVLNIYFIKWLGLNLRGTKFDLLVTFFTFQDIDSIFWWLFCTFRNSTCSFLMSLSLDSVTRVLFPSMLNTGKEKLKFLRWLCFSSTETVRGQISKRAEVIAW